MLGYVLFINIDSCKLIGNQPSGVGCNYFAVVNSWSVSIKTLYTHELGCYVNKRLQTAQVWDFY